MPAPIDDSLRLTPGVAVQEGAFVHTVLGLAIPQTHPEARRQLLEFGLASETLRWGRRIVTSPSRAVPLPSGLIRAGIQSVVHNSNGLLRWWLVVFSIAVVGVAAQLPSLTGIAAGAVLFLLSVLSHEAGHVVAYRLAAGSAAPGILVSKGGRCYLVRAALPPFRDRIVIASGAAAPLLIAVALIPCAFLLPVLFWAWTSIALGHAIFLFVPVGDGSHLRSSFG